VAVYSERFILADQSGYSQYPVPQGKRAIVMTATAINNTTNKGVVALQINGITIWQLTVPANDGAYASGLRIVAYPGDVLRVWNNFTGMTSSLHGYLLATIQP
jgi:hypothetical protein